MALRDKLAGAQKECPCLLVYQTMLLPQLWDLCRMLKNIFSDPKKNENALLRIQCKKMRSELITEMLKGLTHLNPRRHRGVDATPSGFPKITRERIGRSSRNLVYLTVEQCHNFPENFKSVPTMTFDLWPDFRGHIRRNLRSVPFQRLKLANFGMFAGDITWIGVGRWYPWFALTLWSFRGHPRSSEVSDLWWPHIPFLWFLCPQGWFAALIVNLVSVCHPNVSK